MHPVAAQLRFQVSHQNLHELVEKLQPVRSDAMSRGCAVSGLAFMAEQHPASCSLTSVLKDPQCSNASDIPRRIGKAEATSEWPLFLV
jgi:hypothetical protein